MYITGIWKNPLQILLAKVTEYYPYGSSTKYLIDEPDILFDYNWEFYDEDNDTGYYEETSNSVEDFDSLNKAIHELIIEVFDE